MRSLNKDDAKWLLDQIPKTPYDQPRVDRIKPWLESIVNRQVLIDEMMSLLGDSWSDNRGDAVEELIDIREGEFREMCDRDLLLEYEGLCKMDEYEKLLVEFREWAADVASRDGLIALANTAASRMTIDEIKHLMRDTDPNSVSYQTKLRERLSTNTKLSGSLDGVKIHYEYPGFLQLYLQRWTDHGIQVQATPNWQEDGIIYVQMRQVDDGKCIRSSGCALKAPWTGDLVKDEAIYLAAIMAAGDDIITWVDEGMPPAPTLADLKTSIIEMVDGMDMEQLRDIDKYILEGK